MHCAHHLKCLMVHAQQLVTPHGRQTSFFLPIPPHPPTSFSHIGIKLNFIVQISLAALHHYLPTHTPYWGIQKERYSAGTGDSRWLSLCVVTSRSENYFKVETIFDWMLLSITLCVLCKVIIIVMIVIIVV